MNEEIEESPSQTFGLYFMVLAILYQPVTLSGNKGRFQAFV